MIFRNPWSQSKTFHFEVITNLFPLMQALQMSEDTVNLKNHSLRSRCRLSVFIHTLEACLRRLCAIRLSYSLESYLTYARIDSLMQWWTCQTDQAWEAFQIENNLFFLMKHPALWSHRQLTVPMVVSFCWMIICGFYNKLLLQPLNYYAIPITASPAGPMLCKLNGLGMAKESNLDFSFSGET